MVFVLSPLSPKQTFVFLRALTVNGQERKFTLPLLSDTLPVGLAS